MAGLNRKWELGAAILLSVVIFAGTLRDWTPFGPVMSFGEKVKGSWEGKFKAPPVLHMETYTLDQMSALLDSVPVPELITTLNMSEIKIPSEASTLREIADENHVTPSDIYKILASKYNKHAAPVQGEVSQGYGKYTVKTAAEKSGKEVSDLINILKDKGIEASGETSLRTIADQLGLTPREVYSLLTGSN